ncbi:uncharacterized protein LOC132739120 [Ruditapes philippinarum]|uniref:uncharacterized protein LOC132739120 n=1 Tax=Ruditapes philippinarum TaxID=129788 RepID=UPI00295ACED4|nr:uncharacterized protein LOC132739120 [Ruditapes philippinarum]
MSSVHLSFPVYSSGPHGDKEYESPRSNKTAPAKKESFLEDVITAIENDKPSPERDKRRRHHYTALGVGDELGYCNFCCRQLYFRDTKFCDKACENRKRQLSWKAANIGNGNILHPGNNGRRPQMPLDTGQQRLTWRSWHDELSKTRRNRYIWGDEPRRQEQFSNFTDYKPSWEMYGH